MSIYAEAVERQADAAELRRWFHSHPESSFQERGTAAYIRKRLDALEILYTPAGETGTVAVIRGLREKPVVALRADIDALEIQEQNQVPYCSQTPGLMHACGHDAHAAALLTAAALLQAHRDQLNGTVKLIFQPAEEVGRGADAVIASGLLGDVDAFFGIHVQAMVPVGTVQLQPGAIMAGCNSLEIDVYGKSGHAGRPHEAVDAIAAGTAIVEALQHVAARELDPTESATISVCQFHAGTRRNIIANHAKISGTVRVASEKAREQTAEAIRRIVAGVGSAHRAETSVDCEFVLPIVQNSEELYETAVRAVREVLPEGSIIKAPVRLGTEDFSAYGQIAPAFFAFVGAGGEHPHHSDHFDIDERVLPIAAAIHTAFAIQYLADTAQRSCAGEC